MKKIKIVFLLFLFSIPLSFNFAKENEIINNQAYAKQLKDTPINVQELSGWNNDKATLFLTLYDNNGAYRGYRIFQIFKNDIDQETINQYKKDGKNQCSISEVNKTTINYDNSEHQATDIICMQDVGNENAFTINENIIDINVGYGKSDGYLVGASIFNKTFENPTGSVIVDNNLFILSDEGGKANIIDIPVVEEQKPIKKHRILIGISIVVIICLLILITLLIFKKRKNNNLNNKESINNDGSNKQLDEECEDTNKANTNNINFDEKEEENIALNDPQNINKVDESISNLKELEEVEEKANSIMDEKISEESAESESHPNLNQAEAINNIKMIVDKGKNYEE